MQVLLNGLCAAIVALSAVIAIMLFMLIVTYQRAKRNEGMILSLHEYHKKRIKARLE